MEDAFSNAADLSQIDGTKNLKVSDVVHQAFVEVRLSKYNGYLKNGSNTRIHEKISVKMSK